MARPTTFFHGTNSVAAVEALLSGEPLRYVGQTGVSAARMRGSDKGFVHLTPAIAVAAKYAKAFVRIDRPSRAREDVRPLGVVFAFEPAPGAPLWPDEDELGWALRLASEARASGKGAAHFQERMIFNRTFASALASDAGLVEALEAEGFRSLPGSILSLTDTRRAATAASIARLGRAMRERFSPEILEAVIQAGSSVATTEELVPVAAWEWDANASRRLGKHLPWNMEDLLLAARELPLPGTQPGLVGP